MRTRGVAGVIVVALALVGGSAAASRAGRIVEYGTCIRLSGTANAGLARVVVERAWPENPRPFTAVRDRAWQVVDAPPLGTQYVLVGRSTQVVGRSAVRVRPRLSVARVAGRPVTLEATVGAARPLTRASIAVERLVGGRWKVERTLRLGPRLVVRFQVAGPERLRLRLDPGTGYVPAVSRPVAPGRVAARAAVRRARGTSLAEVLGRLRAVGLPMCRATTADPMLFGIPGQVYVNPAGLVEAFEFRSAAEATAAGRRVSRDGSTISTPTGALSRDVLAPERWFRAGRVLVHDVGPSPTTLGMFRAVLGAPFAGR
jgi:hypothetical protein